MPELQSVIEFGGCSRSGISFFVYLLMTVAEAVTPAGDSVAPQQTKMGSYLETSILDEELNSGDIWLFGYGSLIWRPDFPFVQRRVAVVDGWVRKFWQGSHDHRGVPEAPGRVVTLIPAPRQQCAGMAFQINRKDAREIFHALDYREKNGYERHISPCLLVEEAITVSCVFYIATDTNPAYLGPAPLPEIAQHINGSAGPSGSNRDYLLQLAAALRELNLQDEHVFALEREILLLQSPGSDRATSH